MPTVILKGFAGVSATKKPVVSLISDPGSGVTLGANPTLNGSYRLQIDAFTSAPVVFDGSVRIATVDAVGPDTWQLGHLDPVPFVFTAPVVMRDGANGPWMGFSQVSLRQVGDPKRTAYISLEDLALSLVGYEAYQAGGSPTLFYPQQRGVVSSQALQKAIHPEGGYRGYFLLSFAEGGFAVRAAIANQARLNAATAVMLDLNNDCDIHFRVHDSMGIPAPKLIVTATPGASGARIRSDSAVGSGVALATRPSGESWKRLDMPASRLETDGPLLRVTNFVAQEATLGFTAALALPQDETTLLYAPTSRLTFELGLPMAVPAAAAAAPPASARFVYRGAKNAAMTGTISARRERHYGIRVQGLGNRLGQRAVLEADIATVEVGSSGTFGLLAGVGTTRLSPKPDPQTGQALLRFPAGDVEVNVNDAVGVSPLMLDSNAARFQIRGARLVARPLGSSSRLAASAAMAATNNYAMWELEQPAGMVIDFDIVPTGLQARQREQWLAQFTTREPLRQYSSVEQPGTSLRMDPPTALTSPAVTAVATPPTKTGFTITKPGGKEIVAYSALFAGLSWIAVKGKDGASFDKSNFLLQFAALTDAQATQYVKSNGVGDLIVVYTVARNADGTPKTDQTSGIQTQGIKQFIDDNRVLHAPTAERYYWPFMPLLVMPLYEKVPVPPTPPAPAPPQPAYLYDFYRTGWESFKTRVCFDLSGSNGIPLDSLGWTADEFSAICNAAPALWPRGSLVGMAQRQGARLDPSDPAWRGVFFRDLPLKLTLSPDAIGAQSKFLKTLLDKVNNTLVLDYGWEDEKGATWSGGIHLASGNEIDFTPSDWASFFAFSLLSLNTKGAAGKVVTAEAQVRFRLNALSSSGGKPVELIGGLGFDLEGSNPVALIDVSAAPGGAPVETDSLPGFSNIKLLRMTTDLHTSVRVELGLTATPPLAAALPFLAGEQLAILTVPLQGDVPTTIALALPNEVETKLFGRWPFTVTGIVLSLGAKPQLVIGGRLHLGIPGLESIGGRLVLAKDGTNISFDVLVDQIAISLSFGGLKISGSVKWGDANASTTQLGLPAVPTAGAARDFSGMFTLSDPGVIDGVQLLCKIGNRGESTYWIGSIVENGTLNLGLGELRKPGLLIAHNADISGGGLLKALANPNASALAPLRPTGDIDKWLAQWGPASHVGTVIAGTGYYNCHSKIASAKPPDTGDNLDLMSALVFSDSGLLRVDGVLAVLENEAATLRFALIIDYTNRQIIGGAQIPTIKIPPGDNPEYEIQPGFVELGIGFKNTFYFRLGIGWPPLLASSQLERDWSKSTRVYIREMFPINTFWGGFLAELSGNDLFYGFAIKAGWTWRYAVGGNFARASADLELSIGGVFEFRLTWAEGLVHGSTTSAALTGVMQTLRQSPAVFAAFSSVSAATAGPMAALQELHQLAVTSIAAADLKDVDLCVRATLYGDIIGNASLEFLGVTLAAIHLHAYARFQVCGSTKEGITLAWARVGFDVSVTILCVTFHAEATIDIYLIPGECHCVDSSAQAIAAPLSALSPPAAAAMLPPLGRTAA
jgi:hypothetical protein